MNFSDIYHDYIEDIPMDIGRKFYPTPNIEIEDIFLPTSLRLTDLEYNFEAEARAIEMFDKQNEPITVHSTSTASLPTAPASSSTNVVSEVLPKKMTTEANSWHGLSQEVLVPQQVGPSTPVFSNKPSVGTPSSITAQHSFHDFEPQNNVFDDMEVLALDEKKALREILMTTSTQSSHSSINNNGFEKKSISPPLTAPPAGMPPPLPPHNISKGKPREKTAKEDGLKKRLLDKGFRADIVEASIEKVPRGRYVHIEYYMKACRTLEKTGRVTVDDALDFLTRSDLTDKNVILNYADASAHLLSFGFPQDRVFAVVDCAKGDRVAAVNEYNKYHV